jgi:hypothetical protein
MSRWGFWRRRRWPVSRYFPIIHQEELRETIQYLWRINIPALILTRFTHVEICRFNNLPSGTTLDNVLKTVTPFLFTKVASSWTLESLTYRSLNPRTVLRLVCLEYKKNQYIWNIVSRDSSVGIATGYGLDDQGGESSSPGRVKNFYFSISSRPALGSTQPPIKWVPGALSRG